MNESETPTPEDLAAAETVRNGPPWENRKEHGLIVAFAKTVEESALHPVTFFRTLSLEGNLLDAALYGLGIAMVAALVELIWSAVLVPLPFFLAGQLGGVGFGEVAALAAMSWAKFFITPILAGIAILFVAGVIHLCLMLTGAAKQSFETSFRLACYATTPLLLTLLPFCGNLIGRIWFAVLLIIAVRECHETTTGAAALAVILPAILVFGCCGILLMGLVPLALSG